MIKQTHPKAYDIMRSSNRDADKMVTKPFCDRTTDHPILLLPCKGNIVNRKAHNTVLTVTNF